MAELTKEYFDKKLDNLVTKRDLDKKLVEQTKELKVFAQEQTDSLARIVATTVAEPMERHFVELKDYLEV